MYRRVFVSLLLLIGLGQFNGVVAQQADSELILSLDDALKLASKNNTELQKALADLEAAKAGNQQALAAFLPSVELSSSYSASDDPLYAFGFKLQQQSVTMADFDPNIINSPGETNHFSSQVLVEQPLVNIDAWMGKAAASSQLKSAGYKTEFTQSSVEYLVKQTYFALQLAHNKVDVMRKAKETTAAYVKVAEDNLAQGYMKEADVMTIKVRNFEQEAKLKAAENDVQTVKEKLNFLMGRSLDETILIADSLKQVSFTFNTSNSIFNRPDVLAMQHGMNAQEQMKRSDLMKFAPRVNAFGTYNFYDSDFASFGSNSYLVGLKLQWRIFNGGRNMGKYNESKARYSKAQINYAEYLEKGNMELSQARRAIVLAESQLHTYAMAAEESKESFRIISDRYQQGMERTSDLLMSESKVESSQLMKLNAIYNYNIAVFKYQLLVSESKKNND